MIPLFLSIIFALGFNVTIFAAAGDLSPVSPRGRSIISPKGQRKGSPPRRKSNFVVPRIETLGTSLSSSTPESRRSPRIQTEPEKTLTPRGGKQAAETLHGDLHVQYKSPEQSELDLMHAIMMRLETLRSSLGDLYTQTGNDFLVARSDVRRDFFMYLKQIIELLERACPREERQLLKMIKAEINGVVLVNLRCYFDYKPSLQIASDVTHSQELDEIMTLFYTVQWQWFCGTATDKEDKIEAAVQKFLPLWNTLGRYFFLWKLHEELTGSVFTCT